jgi:hypothetical protein
MQSLRLHCSSECATLLCYTCIACLVYIYYVMYVEIKGDGIKT